MSAPPTHFGVVPAATAMRTDANYATDVACHVVPLVSDLRSSNTMSVHPSLPRW